MHMTNYFIFCLLCLFVSYVVVLLGILLHLVTPSVRYLHLLTFSLPRIAIT
jgi:hypothetical protein